MFQCWPNIETALAERPVFAGILAINLLAAEGEASPVFVYKNGESCRPSCFRYSAGINFRRQNLKSADASQFDVCRRQIVTSEVDPAMKE